MQACFGIDFGHDQQRGDGPSGRTAPCAPRNSAPMRWTCSAPVLCFWTQAAGRGTAPAARGRPGGDRGLSRRPARLPADHVAENLPGAAQLHPDPGVQPHLHAGGSGSDLPARPVRRRRGCRRVRAWSPAARCASPASAADDAFGEGTAARGRSAALGSARSTWRWSPLAAGYRFTRGLTAPATVLIRRFRRRHQRLLTATLRAPAPHRR